MRVVNFGSLTTKDEIVIIQPTCRISSNNIKITAKKESFFIEVGCQKNIEINKDNILQFIEEANGKYPEKGPIVKCIIADGDKKPTEANVIEGRVRVLAEETTKFYISSDDRVFKKDDGRWDTVDVKMSPGGTYFAKIKDKFYWLRNKNLSDLDMGKIRDILEIIREFYYPTK